MKRLATALFAPALSALILVAGCSQHAREAARAPAPATATAATPIPAPPVAERHAYAIESPNGTRNDDYYWLRDDTRSKPEVLDYLKAENAYTDAVMAHTKAGQDLLFKEIVGRIKQDDSTVPQLENGYWYYRRFEEGREYPIYARKKGALDAPEQVMFDGNAMAAGHGFFQLGNYEVSRDTRLAAYAVDTVGRRQWVLHVRNLATGEDLPDTIANVEASIAWADDNRTVLYVEKDPVTLLSMRVRKHVLGTDPKNDPLVYEEKDHSYYLAVSRPPADPYVWISLRSTVASEQRVAKASDPKLAFHVLIPRERDHLYQAIDFGHRFLVRTNWKARNYRIVEVPERKVADRAAWHDVVPARDDVFIEDFFAFKDALAIEERAGGLHGLRVRNWRDGKSTSIAGDDPSYTAVLGDNRDPASKRVRYTYTSLTTPLSEYDYDLATGTKTLLKRAPVLGDFDPSHYTAEFVWTTARDGTKVPVSLVYRKGFKRDGTAPMLQYGYGSYGLSSDPRFNSNILSLLDRGFVYAIAHVRGGQELGRRWYDEGHLLAKKNTFNDFVDATRWLVANGYAAKDKVFAMGGSAGGLLMGAVTNQCPECYRGVLALVPFVDVVTTMLDESIPLTTNEFDEWGNPKQREYYDYMLSYSPYDNVERKDYPALFVGTGLWDSQVQYYEPAKWVAKLRAMKTDRHPLLLHVNMEAGHGGKSGRFQAFHETAMYYAFVFDQLGRDVTTESPVAAAH